MILWRATFPRFLESLGLVVLFVLGVVVLVVSIEKAAQPAAVLFNELRFQLLTVLVWLSPLITALGVSLTCVRQQNSGEARALACSGFGPAHQLPMALMIGLIMSIFAITAAEWLIPLVAESDMPAWVWARGGAVRTVDGLFVPADLSENIRYVTHVEVSDFNPRLAPLREVIFQSSAAATTELWARPSRAIACVGFAILGMTFGRFRQSMVWVMVASGVLILIDAICWSMGAQNQLIPWFAGSVSAWGWAPPSWIAWRYSLTSNQ